MSLLFVVSVPPQRNRPPELVPNHTFLLSTSLIYSTPDTRESPQSRNSRARPCPRPTSSTEAVIVSAFCTSSQSPVVSNCRRFSLVLRLLTLAAAAAPLQKRIIVNTVSSFNPNIKTPPPGGFPKPAFRYKFAARGLKTRSCQQRRTHIKKGKRKERIARGKRMSE